MSGRTERLVELLTDDVTAVSDGAGLGRLLLRLFQTEPEIMGLLALMLLQHSRSAARLDGNGEIVLLEQQDRSRWSGPMIAEGLALIDKAMRHRRPGAYLVQAAIAALHARARSRRTGRRRRPPRRGRWRTRSR